MSAINTYALNTAHALARLDARERELSERERVLTDELTRIDNERGSIRDDKETLSRAQAIHDRLFKVSDASGEIENDVDAGGQLRARIGNQRYAMLAALRLRGRLNAVEIGQLTKLSLGRVREQMRSDTPTYVVEESLISATPNPARYYLTEAGHDLLKRFEEYRISQGKPLPLMVSDGSQDEEEIDPAHSKSDEAGVQGLHSATVKPAGEVVHDNT